MTSNVDAGPSRSPPYESHAHSRRSSRDAGTIGAGSTGGRVRRNGKSSDRLHRLGGAGSGSSTHLPGKRSKSHTNLTSAHAAESGRNEVSPTGKAVKGKRDKRGANTGTTSAAREEEGWTSASAESEAETPERSRGGSPAIEQTSADEEDDEEDEGLTIGVKRSSAQKNVQSAAKNANSRQPGPAGTAISMDAGPPRIARSDTASTLVANGDSQLSPHLQRQDQQAQMRPFPTADSHSDTSPHPRQPHLQRPNRTDSDVTLGSSSGPRASTLDGQGVLSVPSTSRSREETPPPTAQREGSLPTTASSQRHGHLRISSSASAKTLTGSPASVSSRLSARSRFHSLMPREHHSPAPPMLSTHNALAGHLGALQEDQRDFPGASPSRLGIPPSASEPFHLLADRDPSSSHGNRLRRKASISSQSSTITLPAGLATVGSTDTSQVARDALSPSHRNSTDVGQDWERRRTESTRSLTGADAAKLAAKLRQARDAMDEQRIGGSGGTGVAGASGGRASASLDPRQSKPIISTFGKEQERRDKPIAVTVSHSSVFAPGFTRAMAQRTDAGSRSVAKSAADAKGNSAKCTRYVGFYGLSGPAIEKTPLNDALLAPSFDGDEFEASWAPALANAAGLGARSFTRFGGNPNISGGADALSSELMEDGTLFHDPSVAFTGSAAVNGPNATPVHLIHGLTAISPDPFPLDAADAPSFHLHASAGEHGGQMTSSGSGLTADPAILRAIALTSQVLSTHRSHLMTRRFFDPMSEGLERSMRPSARTASGPAGAQGSRSGSTGGRTTPSSPRGSGSGSHALTSRALSGSSRLSQARSQSNGHLSVLGDDTSPVKGLKRVWSSGSSALARDGSGTTAASGASTTGGPRK